jgi:hypothetical protein
VPGEDPAAVRRGPATHARAARSHELDRAIVAVDVDVAVIRSAIAGREGFSGAGVGVGAGAEREWERERERE